MFHVYESSGFLLYIRDDLNQYDQCWRKTIGSQNEYRQIDSIVHTARIWIFELNRLANWIRMIQDAMTAVREVNFEEMLDRYALTLEHTKGVCFQKIDVYE